jgi:UDP-N-acetylglucosamine--N-acetylmuramyl-(pentapeptide) pyrophosphoryl-undecaprenol N-acetylglucosamine transferase
METVKMATVLIMAGGTGGHVFPALAIAQELQKQGISVYWLGTRRGLEARVVPEANIDIKYISINGLRGKGVLSLLAAPFKISLALWQAITIIRKLRPDAVVGLGGFVTGPGGVAAWLLRVPLLIHEQNAIAGLTNRWLAKLATTVMEAFPNTFSKNYHAIYTGNPLRANIIALNPSTPSNNPLHILIVGGSLGAKALNDTVPKALQQLNTNIEVWHQTGNAHIESMEKAYDGVSFKTRIVAFIDDIAEAYQWADLVICRAGASTISELAQAGVASILIPYPYAVDDHQTSNAKFLSDNGAAILLPSKQLSVENLVSIITDLDPSKLETMSLAARQCAKPEALEQVIDLIKNEI